jgi:hypothetical protein
MHVSGVETLDWHSPLIHCFVDCFGLQWERVVYSVVVVGDSGILEKSIQRSWSGYLP